MDFKIRSLGLPGYELFAALNKLDVVFWVFEVLADVNDELKGSRL